MKKLLTLFGFLAFVFALKAQNGDISGKVTDENGEGVPLASVQLVDDRGAPTGRGTTTDFDGNYSLKPLVPGRYNVQFSYIGYGTQVQQGIVVSSDKSTFIDVKLKSAAKELKEVEVIQYKIPLIDPGQTTSQNVVSSEEIANMATKSVEDIAATTAGVFQTDQGGGLNIRGARGESTQYYVDGVKVVGTPTIPATSIEQEQVITGGVPAKYGDVTGGIVNITSKAPTADFHGGVEVQTTQGLDAFGYNLVNGYLNGPIWKQKKTNKVLIGFYVNFQYLHQLDPNPSAIGVWQVKPNILDSLEEFPLLKSQTSSGFNLRANTVDYSDMFIQQVKPNTPETDYSGNGRLDFRPADNITITVGGSAVFTQYNLWVQQYSLFNSYNDPPYTTLDWRVYGRFTHNIQSKQAEEDEKAGKKNKSSAFQNAYYSIQVDYEKYKTTYQGAGGTNPFDYGYIGNFVTKSTPVFSHDTFYDAKDNTILTGWKQVGVEDTAVVFTPANINPYSTNFTTEYYELLGAQKASNGSYEVFNHFNDSAFASDIYQIQANQGLINGTRSTIVNNIWYNTGRTYDGYGVSANNDQYRARLEGAFDILKPGSPSRNKHAIEFGIEFEQHIERNYAVSPLELWQRARDLTNLQLTNFNTSDATLRINGVNYPINGPHPAFYLTDTILFNYAYNDTAQSWFDKQLRKSLGMPANGTNIINIDELSPNQLNINMFSPDNLLGAGSNLVSYQGYDPYGNVLTKQPSYYDFYTKIDANGNYVRAIPAYTPIYAAAYISDRFYFKDLAFNLGLRIDRFDANQPVLKDPYSLYPILTTSEVPSIDGKAVTIPSDIGPNYYVYVDNTASPSTITGFRNGSNWYDKYGNLLPNANSIANISNGGIIQPYLKNPNENIQLGNTFDPTGTFTPYTPVITPMPRLQFSFNLTDRALFFAHYDVLSQRPNAGQVATSPIQWLFFQNQVGAFLNDPALKPQTTIDYELGFKQRVSNSAAFTISAFYREFKNLIDITQIENAYPKSYYSYSNIDFGTTKGFTLDFDLRRTANFSLKANYTLQFADGTGSSATTQENLVTSNTPNFRTISPLDFDSRHLINVNATYSFGSGKDYNGPVAKNKQILSETGITFQFAAHSGTPYTEQADVTATQLLNQVTRAISEGSINGSRLPWYFRLNMRVWKDFDFVTGKKKENSKKDRRHVSLEIYLQIQNLLNTQNVIAIYRYTGTANSDGFLNDPASAPAIQSSLSPQAFKDQYAAAVNNPNNYSLPRRIYLGGIFDF